MTPHRYVAAALALTASLAVGCSDDGGAADADPPAGGRSTSEQATPWAEQTATRPNGLDDPLVTFPRIDELAFGSTTAILKERDRRAVECMADRGYEIEIQVGPRTLAVLPGAVDVEPRTRREFAEQWGFGFAAGHDAEGEFDPALTALTQSQPLPTVRADEYGIPRVQIDFGAALAANGDFDAVNRALNEDGDRPSCQNVANAALELTSAGPFHAAAELRQQVLQRLAADPGITQLLTDYQQCLTDAGFPGFDDPTAAFVAMREALFSFRSDPGSNVAPTFESLTPEQRQRFHELQHRERALAVANVDCEATFTPAARQRSDQIQREVLDDNRPLVRVITPDRRS
jgi:hypothetical protein